MEGWGSGRKKAMTRDSGRKSISSNDEPSASERPISIGLHSDMTSIEIRSDRSLLREQRQAIMADMQPRKPQSYHDGIAFTVTRIGRVGDNCTFLSFTTVRSQLSHASQFDTLN